MTPKKIVIVGAVRTPIGAIGGGLSSLQALDLATITIKALIDSAEVDPTQIEYTTYGWVVQDPRAPNLAKTAAELAGIPPTSGGTTIHENCASGGAAIHSMARRILLDEVGIGVAGGVESMSNVPRFLAAGRLKGQMYGDMQLMDGLFASLTDAYAGDGELMGLLTERLVEKYDLTREEQDEVALWSHQSAVKTWDDGLFADYVVPVEIPQRRGDPRVVVRDEGPRDVTPNELAEARPYFKRDGTITTLNASSINDGSAALLLASEERAVELGLKPLAELKAYHNIGVQREYMGEGAFKVVPPLLEKCELTIGDIDFFELNEAFAAVVAAAFKFLPDLPRDRTNAWGSGISLGHPVGATGARQVVDMVHQLRRREGKLGVTARCVGGGMGSGEVLLVR
jgi:acetyl-CoA C-acetyltransferase